MLRKQLRVLSGSQSEGGCGEAGKFFPHAAAGEDMVRPARN